MDYNLYAERIITDFLRLQDGDALSINTEDKDFHFASIVARKALNTTNVTVKIVVTENGKPVEVTDFDVENKTASPTRRMAMLRLKHVDKAIKDEAVLETAVEKEDLSALHKLGHLADPIVTGRRISVPWCVVPVFEDPDSEEAGFTSKKLNENVSSHIKLADYRKSYMEHSDMDEIHLYSDDCNLTLRVPARISFIGGTSSLSDGRTYVNTIDFDRISFAVDKNSANGYLKGRAAVFGKEEELELEFKNGELSVIRGSEKLRNLLSFDDELNKVGYISLRDKDFILSLGGSLQDSLERVMENMEEIPSYFNSSIYSLKIHLNNKLSVSYSNFSGKTTELIRRGFFLD